MLVFEVELLGINKPQPVPKAAVEPLATPKPEAEQQAVPPTGAEPGASPKPEALPALAPK
jgi:hypothetical protein